MDPAAHADAVQSIGPSRRVVFDGNRVTGGRGFIVQFGPDDYDLRDGQREMVGQTIEMPVVVIDFPRAERFEHLGDKNGEVATQDRVKESELICHVLDSRPAC